MRTAALVLPLVLLACSSPQPPVNPTELTAFARDNLGLGRFRLARVDLNGDEQPEAVLYATDQSFCGTAGCTLFVLSPTESGYRLVGRTPATRLPLGLMSTSHNGWRDLAVTVSGGVDVGPYLVRLTHDGTAYPRSAFGPSIDRVDGNEAEILLAPLAS